MTQEDAQYKPLIKQIFDDMFSRIEDCDEFDTSTFQNLKQIAASGNLARVARVTEVLQAKSKDIS